MNAIKRAAESLESEGIILGSDVPQVAAIIKRELDKAVPAKKVPGQTALRLYARTTSWNECRKAFLGEAE